MSPKGNSHNTVAATIIVHLSSLDQNWIVKHTPQPKKAYIPFPLDVSSSWHHASSHFIPGVYWLWPLFSYLYVPQSVRLTGQRYFSTLFTEFLVLRIIASIWQMLNIHLLNERIIRDRCLYQSLYAYMSELYDEVELQ